MQALSELSLELTDSVQFIYELAFAKRELESLGVKFELRIDGGARFFAVNTSNIDRLVKRSAYFKRVGNRLTDYAVITSKNRKQHPNYYLTHWYYPYTGKFHPQMIRAILNLMQVKQGDTILDPFIGSGTAAVESQLMGVNCVGYDISPLCVLLSAVKTSSYKVADEVSQYRSQAITSMTREEGEGFGKRAYIEFLDSISDQDVRNFYLIAKMIYVSEKVRRHRKIKTFEKNLDLMILSAKDFSNVVDELGLPLGRVNITENDSRELSLKDNSVDGILTSPPYSIALNYMENDRHALTELGVDIGALTERCVGVRGKGREKLSHYSEDMRSAYSEMARVLKPQRYCAVIIGDAKYDGIDTATVSETIETCQQHDLKLVDNIPKYIFGFYNRITDEKVLLFRKEVRK